MLFHPTVYFKEQLTNPILFFFLLSVFC